MREKTKKLTILLAVFFFSLMLVFPASAADNDTDIVNADDNLLTADELSTDTNKMDVKLTTNDQYGIYGNSDTRLIATLVGSDGKNVTDGSVQFIDVFGKNYTAELKKNGNWESEVFVGDIGQFNITCKYIGTDLYNNAESSFLLTVPVANTTCHNVVATRYDDTVYFTGNMVSDYTQYAPYNDFEEVTRGIVTVYVDGEKLGSCDLDVNGNYVYVWKTARNLINQTISFTGEYSDKNKRFNPSNFSKSFKFEIPKDTNITSWVTVMDNNELMVTGIVVDEDGNMAIGGTITVNGQYKVPVDTNGKFKFYITDQTPEKIKYEIGVFDWGSKADIRANQPLMDAIEHTEIVDQLIDLCQQGTPYIKFGNGNGKTVVVNVGTHGGELASQVAGFRLINHLVEYAGEIDGTLYIIPTIFPEATANNTRIYNGTNLNTVADVNGTLSNHVVKFACSINADGLGDFHNTRHGDNDVGITCVMGSWIPTPESDRMAVFIASETGYTLNHYPEAGVPYAGAIEDLANLNGVPSVTCESLSNHRAVEYGTPEMSFNEMRAFLRYFGLDTDEMIHLNLNGTDELILEFTSPYNYNPSSVNITLPNVTPTPTPKVIDTNFITSDLTILAGDSGKIEATLVDDKNNTLANKTVAIFVDGEIIALNPTDENGTISADVKYSEATTKYAYISFVDLEAKYYPALSIVKITVNKKSTTLTAKAATLKVKKAKKISVTLKSNGKAIANKKVTIKVNGKTFQAKTNSKGIAKVNVKVAKTGKFTATVKFAGDNAYKAITKKIKITVKK